MAAFPELVTQRLLLNRLQDEDIPLIVEYAGDAEVSRTTQNIPYPYQRRDAEFWIRSAREGFVASSQYTFAIRLNAEVGGFMGGIGLKVNARYHRASLGYWIAKPFWGQGYMTEAASTVLRYGFMELKLNKIYATHFLTNPASGKVMQKVGMVEEGKMIDHVFQNGQYHTLIQYRLMRNEFANLKSTNLK